MRSASQSTQIGLVTHVQMWSHSRFRSELCSSSMAAWRFLRCDFMKRAQFRKCCAAPNCNRLGVFFRCDVNPTGERIRWRIERLLDCAQTILHARVVWRYRRKLGCIELFRKKNIIFEFLWGCHKLRKNLFVFFVNCYPFFPLFKVILPLISQLFST